MASFAASLEFRPEPMVNGRMLCTSGERDDMSTVGYAPVDGFCNGRIVHCFRPAKGFAINRSTSFATPFSHPFATRIPAIEVLPVVIVGLPVSVDEIFQLDPGTFEVAVVRSDA